MWVCLSIGGILSWSRLGSRGPRGAERTENALRSPAPPTRTRARTLPNGPRNILPQRSVPATTHLHGDVRVRPRQSSSSRVPRPSALAFTPGTVRSVGSYRTCPEPGGIFPDQGSIENTLSPASSAGGFFTTGPPSMRVARGSASWLSSHGILGSHVCIGVEGVIHGGSLIHKGLLCFTLQQP